MDSELYDNLDTFFEEVFSTAPPALSPEYPFAEVKVWQQLDQEYPGAVDLQNREFDERGAVGYTWWHSDPDAKSYYEWLDDAREGKVMDPRQREKEIREELYSIPDYWKVIDVNWNVSVLNPAINYRIESASNEKSLSPDDWFDYIRGKATLSLSMSAKSNRPSFIFTNGDVFLLIQNQDVYVLDKPQIQESLKYFVKDRLLVTTFAVPVLNWTFNFPSKLLRR
jgi:hypothetical protein